MMNGVEEAKCWRVGPGERPFIKCACAPSDQWFSSAPMSSEQAFLALVHPFDP